MKKISTSKSIVKGYLVLVTLMVLVVLSPGTTTNGDCHHEIPEIISSDTVAVGNYLFPESAGNLFDVEIRNELQKFYQQVEGMELDNTIPETGIQEDRIFIDADTFDEESDSLLTNKEWNRVLELVLRNA
jgi:hypothetical protein